MNGRGVQDGRNAGQDEGRKRGGRKKAVVEERREYGQGSRGVQMENFGGVSVVVPCAGLWRQSDTEMDGS